MVLQMLGAADAWCCRCLVLQMLGATNVAVGVVNAVANGVANGVANAVVSTWDRYLGEAGWAAILPKD